MNENLSLERLLGHQWIIKKILLFFQKDIR